MFESLCALLLRLYPDQFQRTYGVEAMELMRDRARHERGVFLRARLLMDLAIDLGATSLHVWHSSKPLLARVDGPPRFEIIDGYGPRPQALAVGMVASLLLFATLTLAIQPKALPNGLAYLSERSGFETSGADSIHDPPQTLVADREANHTLVAAIAANLRERYVDHAIGAQLADALLARDKAGEYASLDLGATLAARINKDIQASSLALGIPRGVFVADVLYSPRPIPLPKSPPPATTEDMRARRRAMMISLNCLMETTETLPHSVGYIRVGYLKLNGFGEVTTCQEMTAKAMSSLNDADALIVDLRDNGGGFGETALQIAGYLFDRPTFMYDPRPNSPVPARTASPMAGNALVDKPVYVLTSSTTQSAAEYFVYNLKMLKRATIVGETTAGRQHSGAFHRLTDHFGMGIQEVAPADNPYPVKGWEIIGVEPDVKVSSADAFEAAKRLAVRSQAPGDPISINPAASGDPRHMRLRMLPNGDLQATSMPVALLLRYAYDVPLNPSPRFSGLFAGRETYDIDVKAPATAAAPGLSAREQRRRMQEMLRGVLTDRFKLVMRVEQKTMPVYALTVASGGPTLQKAAIAEKDCVFDTGSPDSCHTFAVGRGHPLNASAIDMDDLATYIENWADLPVVNRTALSGLFAVETEGWRPMALPPPPPGAPAVGFDDLPTIFTVLGKLGLELKKQEATVPVYTVERIERPAGK